MADATGSDLVNVDHLPCACLVTTHDREVLFANDYFRAFHDWDLSELKGKNINRLLSRASQLFCDSYVIPTAMHEGRCTEILLHLLNANGNQVPMLASVARTPQGNLAWVFVEAVNRNKLFHELETAKLALEDHRVELERLSRTDPLTGVANRRELDAVLRRTFKEADRSGLPVSVLVIDIDKFKSINDTLGHDVGDKVICALANTLRAICRETDTVARLGGDEFVCVLYDTDLAGAEVLADRIRATVGNLPDDPCGYSVSIGVSGRVDHGSAGAAKVLKLADKALYAAKAKGRNATAVCRPNDPD